MDVEYNSQPWSEVIPFDDPQKRNRLGLNMPQLLGPLASLRTQSPAANPAPPLAASPSQDSSLAVNPAEQRPLAEVATNRNSLGERNVNVSPTGDHAGVSRPAPGTASAEADKRPLAVTPKLSEQYGQVRSSIATLASQKPQEPKMNLGKRVLGTMLELSTNSSMGSMGERWLHPAAVEQARQKAGLEQQGKGIEEQSKIANTESEIAARDNPKPDKPESLTQEEAQAVEDLVAQGVKRIDAVGQVKAAGQKPEKPEKQTFEEQSYAEWSKTQKAAGKPADRVTYQKELKAAERAPEREPRQLMEVPQPDGSVKIVEAKPGTVLPKNAKKVGAQDKGPTADEQRRADLGKNLNENLDAYEDIVKRRPDLFGPIAGRKTALLMMTGSNDPDIAALRGIKEFAGMAAVGTHAMRNAQHVKTASDAMMNLYDEPAAILDATKGPLSRARASVKTFTDDVEGQRVQDKATGALTLDEAKQYLQKAGGDKQKARDLAKKDGRTF